MPDNTVIFTEFSQYLSLNLSCMEIVDNRLSLFVEDFHANLYNIHALHVCAQLSLACVPFATNDTFESFFREQFVII